MIWLFFLQKCMFDGWGYRRGWKRNAFTFISTQPASFSALLKLLSFDFSLIRLRSEFLLNCQEIISIFLGVERVSKPSLALEFSHKLKWIFINAHLSVPTLIYRCHNRHLTLPLLLVLLAVVAAAAAFAVVVVRYFLLLVSVFPQILSQTTTKRCMLHEN